MAQRLKLIKPVNAQLQRWKDLKHAKDRCEQGLFLAEGFKVVQELAKSAWEIVALMVMDDKREHWETFLFSLQNNDVVYGLTENQWSKLSQDAESEGVMALVKRPRPESVEAALARASERLLMLYKVNNPNNLGALLRTAQWFGFDTVLLGTGSVDCTNPKVVRTSMGSLFHTHIVEDVNFHRVIKTIKKDYAIIGSHAKKGRRPHACAGRAALLLGSESHGLPESLMKMTDEMWCIPGASDGDSLSLPQAAAIMMYECAAWP
jgi:TrmH family RNA methyltransferase